MGLGEWLSRLFKRGGKAAPAAKTEGTAKHSRAVPAGVKRPLVTPGYATPTKPGEHVRGEVRTQATLIGKDAEFVAYECLCGKRMKAPLAVTGKRTKCPVCGRALDIPTG